LKENLDLKFASSFSLRRRIYPTAFPPSEVMLL